MYLSVIKRPLRLLKNPAFLWDYALASPLRLARLSCGLPRNQGGRHAGRMVLTMEQANRAIFEALDGELPAFIARNGGTESGYICNTQLLRLGAIPAFPEAVMRNGKDKSGLFPAEQAFCVRFADCYARGAADADLSVYWGHIPGEGYILRRWSPGALLIPSRALEPFGFAQPWTRALRGRRVLWIHPFVDLMRSQYEKRALLFENPDVLPEFEMLTVRAVQTLAGEHSEFADWFGALEHMQSQIAALDFDIAILGCGAYAVPLGSFIKRLGRRAIVLGGMTQLLFGIKGERWERSRPDIVAMYNQHWVRPDESLQVAGAERVEGRAYW